MSVRGTYLMAAHAFAALVNRLPRDTWPGPALGVWSLRDLVGHTVAAGLTNVVTALDRPAGSEALTAAESYYALAKSVDPSVQRAANEAATERARSDGAALGDDLAHAVRTRVDQVSARLAAADEDQLLQIHELVGGMRLDAWLPTRTFELAVHSLDIAAATGLDACLPADVLADAAALAARVAAQTGSGSAVLRALTGRGVLPDEFSVV